MLRNLRKEQGVSMILLIVIIVIMVIIFAVSFSTSKDLIDSTKAKKYATIMYLIQGEITTRQEEAEFVAGEDAASIALARSMYIGTKLDMNNATVRDNLNNILSAEVNKNEYDQYYNAANAHGKYNEIKDYWYILTKNDLQKVGIETDFADNDKKVFIVNYVTGEIIYTPGVDVKTLNPETGKEETKKVYTLRTFESL